ncbi:AEC family transporter, partial [bacterium]|nr:AEC family transporter [bacterium]
MTAALAPFFNTILPIFIVPALGFLLGWRGVFSRDAAAGVNRFVFFVANPALLFGILSEAPLTEFNWGLILLYMASVAIIYPLGYLMARHLFRRGREEALLLGMACCFPNHVLFVLPIVTELYGPSARPPLASIITVDSLLIFSVTLYVIDMMRSASPSPVRTLGLQLKNPMTLSIVLGILVNLAGWEIHQGVRTYVNFAGAATAPGALFALGVILSQCDWKRVHAATLA